MLFHVEVHRECSPVSTVELNHADTRPGWECDAHVYLN